MPRSVNAVASHQRKKKIYSRVKGQFGRRKNVLTVAKNAHDKSLGYAYRDRRNKKRSFRGLWIIRINAGARQHGLSYSALIGLLDKKNIQLNRKVLADLAMNQPETFKAVVDAAKA
ncbi:MAG TPA: 50S ribosomal protein L20 [Bacteroidales bacterium]|nr:50S ribosomal protein L20 [Bacteroidales bacterium]